MIGQASGLGLSDEGNSVSRTDINFLNVNVFNSVTSPHVLSCRKSKLCKKKLYIAAHTSNAILVPRCRASFGKHQESRPLAKSNTGSPRFTDFSSLCVKSDKCDWFWSQSIVSAKPFKQECRWTGSLDGARGRDCWCWPKGARPLETRTLKGSTVNDLINAHSQINAPYLIDAPPPLEMYSLY